MRLFHRHHWTHGDKPIETLGDIPEDSLFYRLDCECGESIDGAKLRVALANLPPRWLLKRMGFKEEKS